MHAPPTEIKTEDTNFAIAIRLAVGPRMLAHWCGLMDELPYYSPEIQKLLDANKAKYHVP